MQDQLNKNKETALNLSKAIMAGNWDEVNILLDDSFQYEADGRPAIDKAAYIGFMQGVLTRAFSGMEMEFLHVIADENFVSINYSNKMTHVGDFLGIPATNKTVLASGQFIREVKNGKVMAEWQTTNAAGLMQQLAG